MALLLTLECTNESVLWGSGAGSVPWSRSFGVVTTARCLYLPEVWFRMFACVLCSIWGLGCMCADRVSIVSTAASQGL